MHETHVSPFVIDQHLTQSAGMMRKVIDNPDIKLGTFENKKKITSLVVLIEKWNHLVDIINGRDKYYSPVNRRSIQEKLLSTLTWRQIFCTSLIET